MLLVVGLVIFGIVLVWILAPLILWLGCLPGDLRIERENFRVYVPLVRCLLLSLVLSLAAWIMRRQRQVLRPRSDGGGRGEPQVAGETDTAPAGIPALAGAVTQTAGAGGIHACPP